MMTTERAGSDMIGHRGRDSAASSFCRKALLYIADGSTFSDSGKNLFVVRNRWSEDATLPL
jgi:hypothetical protein